MLPKVRSSGSTSAKPMENGIAPESGLETVYRKSSRAILNSCRPHGHLRRGWQVGRVFKDTGYCPWSVCPSQWRPIHSRPRFTGFRHKSRSCGERANWSSAGECRSRSRTKTGRASGESEPAGIPWPRVSATPNSSSVSATAAVRSSRCQNRKIEANGAALGMVPMAVHNILQRRS